MQGVGEGEFGALMLSAAIDEYWVIGSVSNYALIYIYISLSIYEAIN